MGAAEGRSMFSLESRCVALARAMGAQGVQNGGIDGASVVGSRARRHARAARREPPGHAPRPRVVLGQRRAGQRVGHAPHRAHRAAVPRRLGLHLQRLRLDPALRQHVRPQQLQRRGPRRLPRAAARLGRGRRAAAGDRGRLRAVRERAARAVPGRVPRAGAGGRSPDGRTWREVVAAAGSKDVTPPDPQAVLAASDAIMERQTRDPRRGPRPLGDRLRGGGRARARHGARPGRRRLPADRGDLRRGDACLSKVTDPNDYQGPGTGYEVPAARREQIAAHPPAALARRPAGAARRRRVRHAGAATPAASGSSSAARRGRASDPREVCIGVSPALATKLWFTMSGLPVGEALAQIVAGIEEEGCVGARRARAVHGRPRRDRADGRRARRLRRRRRAAGQGHGAHPPQGPARRWPVSSCSPSRRC